jgi:SAM-dependent methyltransferase
MQPLDGNLFDAQHERARAEVGDDARARGDVRLFGKYAHGEGSTTTGMPWRVSSATWSGVSGALRSQRFLSSRRMPITLTPAPGFGACHASSRIQRKEASMLELSLLIAAAIASAEDHHDATVHHPSTTSPSGSELFDDPGTRRLAKARSRHRDAGRGPRDDRRRPRRGTGYFSVRLAKAVGPKGRVLAIDIEPNLIEHMRERAAKAQLKQLVPVLAAPDDPKLPARAVDLVMIVDTWHHIDDRLHYLVKLASGMKSKGRVAVIDFKKGDFPVGPPDAHKLPPEAWSGNSKPPAGRWPLAGTSFRISTCSCSRPRLELGHDRVRHLPRRRRALRDDVRTGP